MSRDFTKADSNTKLLRIRGLLEAINNELIFSLHSAAARSVQEMVNEALGLTTSMIRREDPERMELTPE